MQCTWCGEGSLATYNCSICFVSMCGYGCLRKHEDSKHKSSFTGEQQTVKLRVMIGGLINNANALNEKKEEKKRLYTNMVKDLRNGLETRSIDSVVYVIEFLQEGKSLRYILSDVELQGLHNKAGSILVSWMTDTRIKETDKCAFDSASMELIRMFKDSIIRVFE